MDKDIQSMMETMGIGSIDTLFEDIPPKFKTPLNLPRGMEEWAAMEHVDALLSKNVCIHPSRSFVGHGTYQHHIPAIVKKIIGRGEFLTSYTPYQPEISQGMLQALYEYQSVTAELTGLPGTNSSMYDMATAMAESALMAARVNRKNRFLIPRALSKEKKQVLSSYAVGANLDIKEYPFDKETGQIDLASLNSMADDEVAGVYVESPNLFGLFEENLHELRGMFPKALLVMGCDPLALSIMKTPAELDFDVAVANGQVLGNPPGFGGPQLGIFTCKDKFIRKMPGRVIGKTVDSQNRVSFCMTLQTREQHIRREKATSNICTNNALCALAFTVHCAYLGGYGMTELAKKNMESTKKWMDMLSSVDGVKAPIFKGVYFNEFPFRLENAAEVLKRGEKSGVLLGVPLSRDLEEMDNVILTCSTEVNTIEGMHAATKVLGGGQ